MRLNDTFILVLSILLCVLGLVVGWWPLSLLGVLLAAFGGRWIVALLFAFLLDCIFGAPLTFLHALVFPFTFLTLCIVIVRALTIRHLR